MTTIGFSSARMMRVRWRAAALLLILMIGPLFCWRAAALDQVVANETCSAGRPGAPLRQTIVLVDESVVTPTSAADVGEDNRRWINHVVEIANAREAQSAQSSSPHEPLTILLARSSDNELIKLFSGCNPDFSPAELAEKMKSTGAVGDAVKWLMGQSAASQLDQQRRKFRDALWNALIGVIRDAYRRTSKSSGVVESGTNVLNALPLLGNAIDLRQGIPRLFVYSRMKMLDDLVKVPNDLAVVRKTAFRLSDQIGGDLQRAEVYLVGVDSGTVALARDFGASFFLGIKGRLAGVGSESLPPIEQPPENVQVFNGSIDYDGSGRKYPVQLRLAVDRSGTLVNSWIEVSVNHTVATPLLGKVACEDKVCQIVGNGKGFTQSWAAVPASEPKFDDAAVPFSGLRYFEFNTNDRGLSGKVFDPLVPMIPFLKSDHFSIELTRSKGILF